MMTKEMRALEKQTCLNVPFVITTSSISPFEIFIFSFLQLFLMGLFGGLSFCYWRQTPPVNSFKYSVLYSIKLRFYFIVQLKM